VAKARNTRTKLATITIITIIKADSVMTTTSSRVAARRTRRTVSSQSHWK